MPPQSNGSASIYVAFPISFHNRDRYLHLCKADLIINRLHTGCFWVVYSKDRFIDAEINLVDIAGCKHAMYFGFTMALNSINILIDYSK